MTKSELEKYLDNIKAREKRLESDLVPITIEEEEPEIIEQTPLAFKETTLPSVYDRPQDFTGKSSLSALAKDEEFATRAARFLEGVGSNDNIFEYLRDADYSLSAAMSRSFQTDNWTPEQIEDYNYLKQRFDNTDLSGFKERFGAFKDIAVDVLADPLNIVAALFAIPTAGTSVATAAATTTAAKAAASKLAKAKLQDRLKAKVKNISQDKALKQAALYGAVEGAAWGGLHNYFLQDIDIDLGNKEDMQLTDIGASTLLGAAFTGTLAGGTRYMRTKFAKVSETNENMPQVLKDKEDKFSNENDIIETNSNHSRKDVIDDFEADEVIESKDGTFLEKDTIRETFDGANNKLDWFLSRSIGKSVSEFVGLVKKAPSLKNLLASIRYDYMTTLTKGQDGVTQIKLNPNAEGVEEITTQTYGEFLSSINGFFQFGLAKAFNTLYRVGFRAKIFGEQSENLTRMLRDDNLRIYDKRTGQNVTGSFIEDFDVNNYTVRTRQGKEIVPDSSYTINFKDGTNMNVKVDEGTLASYIETKRLLSKAFIDGQAANIFKKGTTQISNYLPRIFKRSALANPEGRARFKAKLINSGHADPLNTVEEITVISSDNLRVRGIKEDAIGVDQEVFGKDFLQLSGVQVREGRKVANIADATAEQIENARNLKADEIITDMLSYREMSFENRLRTKGVRTEGSGFMQPRKFTNIADNEIEEFLENDVQTMLETYFTNYSQILSRNKYFGRNTDDILKNKITPIIQELRQNGVSPDEARKIEENLLGLVQRISGLENYTDSIFKRTAGGRIFSDWGKLFQQLAHLPFVTLSSITEPLILLSRVGTADALPTAGIIAKSIVDEGSKLMERTIKGFQRGVLRKKTKGFKDINDETWSELYQTGLALEQAVQERLEGLVGEGIQGSFAKTLQQGFFKVNLLTQWTKAVQLAAFTTGKRLITKNSRLLAEGNLGKRRRKFLSQQLNDLGIQTDDAINWYKSNTKDGKFDFYTAKEADFYKQDLTKGANRFTKEIILNPSTAEGNRPLWFGTPAAQMLVQFAGYPTVFNNTILKRFAYEGLNNPLQAGMSKILPTMLLMTSVAHVGNLIRSNGNSVNDYETGKRKTDGEIIQDAVRRWGGLGPFDYAYRYGNEQERNTGDLASFLKTFAGPLPQDFIDGILYRKGLAEIGVTNLPGYAAYDTIFGDGTKKRLRSLARGKEEKQPTPLLYKYYGIREAKFKGGIVTNVSNVKDEPDERIDKMTGIPYDEQAGFIMEDEEER